MKKIINFKIFKQAVTIWVIFLLAFNPVIAPLAFAEDEIPAVTTITTGDAQSESDVSVIANSNTNIVPGTVTPGSGCNGPELNIDCPGTDSISNQNQADTQSSNTSSAQTGQNSSSGNDGNVNLSTGEATASAETTNQINTNIMELENEASESAEIAEATPSAEFAITNVNDATSQNGMSVIAETGENQANNNRGDVVIDTGNTLAVANIFNLINTNIVGSNFDLLFINLTEVQNDINLFQVWKDTTGGDPADQLQFTGGEPQNSLYLLIENSNRAEINNYLTVSAVSGKNEANDNNNVNLNSGNAISLANITNIANFNLIGSKFLFATINILGSFEGNLILPPREYFMSQNSSQNSISAASQNRAYVEGSIETIADSGGNELNENAGDSNIQTGDAEAISHNLSLLNLNIAQNDWFNVRVNHLGQRQGDVFGWSDPEAKEESEDIMTFSTETTGTDGAVNSQNTRVNNSNEVKINNQISIQAISGQNKADRNSMTSVVTGKAKALANLFNLANLNILGSNLFLGVVNILGDWQGNTIFAYPDVTVAINGPAHDVTPGEEINYNIDVENIGYDDAHDIAVLFELPKGTSYISDTSGQVTEQSGNNLKWSIDTLTANGSLSFDLKLKIDPNLNYEDLLTFWDRLIPKAYALEEGVRDEITAKVEVSTTDKQSDNNNDTSSIATVILFPATSSDISDDQSSSAEAASTTIEINAKNNVNDFIYLGDIITFDLEVKNTGGEKAGNVTVFQDIYNGHPESTGTVEFPIGDIDPGKTAKVNFAIQITDLIPGSYHTLTYATGDNISSNEAVTYFKVKLNNISLISEVQAQEIDQNESTAGEVKGADKCPAIIMRREWWPYALAALFGTLWFLEVSRRKHWNLSLTKLTKKVYNPPAG